MLGTFSALAACINPYWVFPMLGEAPIGPPPKSPVGRLNWSGLSATAPRWGRFFCNGQCRRDHTAETRFGKVRRDIEAASMKEAANWGGLVALGHLTCEAALLDIGR